ncbi:MAG: sigma-54-dependent Fis family transcriptional regulator, partial [bacterium]|nr:sigma-54-dependent Fis family transcriptional regulator [bacterium]
DPDDAELGMVVGGEQTPAPEVLRETTRLTQSGGLSRLGGLRWMDAFLGHLMVRPHGNLEGALGLVVQALEGAGAALVDWHREAPPIVAAAGGKVGELPSAARVLASAEAADGPFYVTVPGAPAVTAVVRPQGAEASGLVVWGGTPERSSWEPLLGLLLRLIDRFRPRSVSPLQEPPPAAGDELRFPPGIVRGEAPAMVALYQEMSSLLQGDVPVLIAGETGVGKEHLAAALHASSRRRGAFVAVNCAAIPAELLEAEMFGIGKGVATGVEARIGKFVEADGGTLLLDEIGDMPKPLQGKLLRALQEKQIHPLGRPAAVVDVRVISATNTDLEAGIREGRFRQDLYYRIAGYVLRVPALRHRCEDIPRLIGHFTRAYCRETGKSVRGITVKALRALTEYAWPGNVRQLDHEIRRLVYLCPHGQAVDSGLLSDPILRPPPAVELLRNEA